MRIMLPDPCLVVLIGASSAGKTTLARQHFRAGEVVSSDQCRLMVADDENDQDATRDAFDLLHYVVSKRLETARLTVVDATSLLPDDRRPLLSLAQSFHVPAVAVVLDVPYEVAVERNEARADRDLPAPTLRTQVERAARSTAEQLAGEGFAQVVTLQVSAEGIVDPAGQTAAGVVVERARLPTDRSDEPGPFDIVGDVHGCVDELVDLLTKLGYDVTADRAGAEHPDGRRAVFVGDLVDRGPDTPAVLRLVMGMVRNGNAVCVPGNHEMRLVRALRGGDATTGHGLAESLRQLAASPPELRDEAIGFLETLPSHAVLDGGQLVVAHAGLPVHMHNRDSAAVRWFALYGDTGGETDEFGHQVRYPWARDYAGTATVVYGHTPVTVPEWVNNTICVDTGCVYGGSLTALRYPERELVSIPATRVYYKRASERQEADRATVLSTRLDGDVRLGAAELAAAEGVVGEGGLDLRWLVSLPPPVPPGPVTTKGDLLEHPEDTFWAYAETGVEEVVCEYQHAGDPAVAVLCRDAAAAEHRFGLTAEEASGAAGLGLGVLYSQTAQPGKPDLVDELHRAVDAAGLWDELATEWLALEVELLSEDRLAPRAVLAAESGVWAGEDRLWHLTVAERLHEASPQRLVATRHTRVAVRDVRSRAQGIAWWQDVVGSGGAGMVVRPLSIGQPSDAGGSGSDGVPFLAPGLQCRGPTYLKALYGDDYGAPENLLRLRDRDVAGELTASRQAFALGVEALERFVKREPMESVHACCFGVLALVRAWPQPEPQSSPGPRSQPEQAPD